MNVSSDNESSILSRSTDEILSDDEDKSEDDNQVKQFNNSDEDIFNMSTQPIDQAASTSNCIYDIGTQPVAFSSPFRAPSQSLLRHSKVSPTKRSDCITPILSIYEMETQEIGVGIVNSNAANESALEATPPCQPNFRGEGDPYQAYSQQNNNSPIEDIHLAATQKLFSDSPVFEIHSQPEEDKESQETQGFEFCPDTSGAPTQPLKFQKPDIGDFVEDSETHTPPTSPRSKIQGNTEGAQNDCSVNTSHGKETDEGTPPSSPVIDLNLSSSPILNSTHRSENLSLLDQTEEATEQCIPETQPEVDEQTQRLYPMLNFPSSQSSVSQHSPGEEEGQCNGGLARSHLSSSPVLDFLMTPVKTSATVARAMENDSSPQLFDLQQSPSLMPVRSEEPGASENSCNPFDPTQPLKLNVDFPAREENLQSDPVDQFAPTQRLVFAEQPGDESVASPVLCCAIDEEDVDPFEATQKLVVRRASKEKLDFSSLSSAKNVPEPKVIIRRSEKVSSTFGDSETSRPALTLQDRLNVQQRHQPEDDAETDTDFEMTFSGSQTSVATSPEPFRGFSRRDMRESVRLVQQIHKIIDTSETEETNEDDLRQSSNPARFLCFGTDYVEPEPVPRTKFEKEKVQPNPQLEPDPDPELEPQPAPKVEPELVRRSVRKRLPNSRLTEGAIFQLDACMQMNRRSTRSTASIGAAPLKKSRNSTITLVTSTPSSTVTTRSGRGRKRASPTDDPLPAPVVVKTETETSQPLENEALKGKRRAKSIVPSAPLSEMKKEPGTEVTTTDKRTGRRLSSADSNAQTNVRVDVDPAPLPSPIAVRRGRRPKVKVEPADQSVVSTRSRSSSLDTTASSTATTSTKATRRRKRALAGKVLVLFTGCDDDSDRLIVHQLGGLIVDNTKKCSVLVTNRIRRTVKFLCAVGLGVPIVSPEWLEMSQRQGKFLDPWQHLLDDAEGQKKFAFDLAASLHAASESPFLAGWIFHATPNVLPPPTQMQDIVESCGGFYIDEGVEDKSPADKKVVISCEQDRASWAAWRRKGALLVSTEAILTGVLRQQFEPEIYQLKP